MKKWLAGALVLTLVGAALSACAPATKSSVSSSTWRLSDEVRSGLRLGNLSCPSTRYCVAADGNDVLQTTNGGSSWTTHRVAHHDAVDIVSCAQQHNCWALGTDKGGDYQYFLRESSDSSWSRATTAVDELEPTAMSALSCPTTKVCLAVGNDTLIGGNADGYPLWTLKVVNASKPSSETWTKSMISFRDGSITQGLVSVACVTVKVCYALVAHEDDGVVLLRTTSEGRSWSPVSITSGMVLSTKALATVTFTSLSCPTVRSCTIAGVDDRQTLITAHSDNAGRSWHWSAQAPVKDLNLIWLAPSISCANDLVCVVTDGRTILRSNDGDVRWQRLSVPRGEVPLDVECPSSSRCYAVASKLVVEGGQVESFGAGAILSFTAVRS